MDTPETRRSDISRYLASYIGVVPTYRDLFGEPATLDQLMQIVHSYPVTAWVSFLSRLQTLLAPPHATDVERHRAAFAGLIGPSVRKHLVDFERSQCPDGNCLTFAEPQIAALQQLAILEAPESAEADFIAPRDFDQLSIALLMTWELMHVNARPQGREDLTAALVQAALRSSFEWTPALATRAYHAYQLSDLDVSPALAELRTAFQAATGVTLSEYILGGLAILIPTETQSPKDIAAAWTPCAPEGPREDTIVGGCVEAFCRIRCATLRQLRAEVQQRDGDRPLHEFTLIALSRYPIVELPGKGRFVLSAARVGDALFEGVRHAIQTASLEGKADAPDLPSLGKLFGIVVEEYVFGVLQDAFGTRFLRVPRSQDRKRADALVVYPNRVIVCEVKSGHTQAAGRRGPRNVREREQELEAIRVPEAAEQIAATISELRSGKLDELLGQTYDWTITNIVPVIVTAEKVALVWYVWGQFEKLIQVITDLPMQDQIVKPRFLDIGDTECLADLAGARDVGQVLVTWANDPVTFEQSLRQHLRAAAIRVGRSWSRSKYAAVMTSLADRLGLDRAKLDFLGSGEP